MRSKEESTRIIYVRHGKTDFPLDRIYCDDAEDPVLNDEGKHQAAHAAELLRHEKIGLIIASPSNRTWMTAEAVANITGAPLEANAELKERRFGIWEGLFFHEIERDYPELYQEWKQNQSAFKPEGGESVYDLLARVKTVIGELITQHPGKTIVVASHVGPIRVCLTDALKMPVEMYRQLNIDYGSLTRMDYGRSQNNLMYMNISSKTMGKG
ncbi:MAG: histidine phosphatase family protein [Pseudomonadota bacterium]